jgi:hypothetical protein
MKMKVTLNTYKEKLDPYTSVARRILKSYFVSVISLQDGHFKTKEATHSHGTRFSRKAGRYATYSGGKNQCNFPVKRTPVAGQGRKLTPWTRVLLGKLTVA